MSHLLLVLLLTHCGSIAAVRHCGHIAAMSKPSDLDDLYANDHGLRGKNVKLLDPETNFVDEAKCFHSLSDIDDTMYALNKQVLKGRIESYTDHRFDAETEYAGVRAFYNILRHGNKGKCSEALCSCDEKVHFLSARPAIKGPAQTKLGQILSAGYDLKDEQHGDFTPGKSMAHYVFHGLKHATGVHRPTFAEVKRENFEKWLARHKEKASANSADKIEQNLVLFNGDNGQGDLCAGQQMLKIAEKAGLKMIVTIHTVWETNDEYKCDEKAGNGYTVDELVRQKKLIRYLTYPFLAYTLASHLSSGTRYGALISIDARDLVFNEAESPPSDTTVKSFGVPQCNEAKAAGGQVYTLVGPYCEEMQLAFANSHKSWPSPTATSHAKLP